METIREEYDRGKAASAGDIALGSPRLYWQTRGAWGEFLTRLMAERFSVAVEHISDITTKAERSFRSGYNDATAAYIDENHGTGSYLAAIKAVDQFRQEYYRRYFESKGAGNE
jgi:hypothetical protein